MNVKFIPLSFINSNEEILKQIKNTVLFSFLFKQYEETTLDYYLETTQYGYTASALPTGKHKLVRITDINDGQVNWNTVPFCDCDAESKYLLKDNDILVARTGGTTGKSFIVNNPPNNAVFASYLIRLRLNENANIDFINHFLNSYFFWSQIIEMKAGSAMPNVNAEKLKTLRMPKCDIGFQEKIVSIFENKNNNSEFGFLFERVNSIENFFHDNKELSTELTHQQDLLTQLRQAFIKDALEGKLVKQNIKEGYATELLDKIKEEKEKLIDEKKIKKQKPLPVIKDEEIPFDIPKNWSWCRLGEIAYIASGSTPSKDAFVGKGIPYLKMYNLKNQQIAFDYKPQFIKEEVHNGQLKRSRTQVGDVIMNIVGPPLGKLAIIPESLPEANFNQAGVLIRPHLFKEMNKWIYYYLNEMSEIDSISTKGIAGQDNISITQSNNMKIPLPPLAEQKRIVKKLEEVMNLCEELKTTITDNQNYTNQLLQVALKDALQMKEEVASR